jgi:hypothetical protein
MRASWIVKLVYTEEELLREHDYAAPHMVAGYRLHGGFDAGGRYCSPRTAVRWDAVRAWQAALVERGWDLLPADPSLLAYPPYPTDTQMKLLLLHGLDQNLWNSLTITGVIEARGRLLTDFHAPCFQRIVVEDVSTMAIGHLNTGLLRAHGMDEGGCLRRGIGGHDAMWFAVRDLVLGKNRYPAPAIPERIGRPDEDKALVPAICLSFEQTILLLMNVLMIEVRAEVVFRFTDRLLRDPDLFANRRDEAREAVTLVDRIRQDEAIHVAYLQTVLSELRSVTFRTRDGGQLAGTDVIDPMWKVILHWHAVENPRLQRAAIRPAVHERIKAHPDGDRLLREFEALDPGDVAVAA